MSDMNNPSDENSGALDDLWADALNEQKTTPTKSAADAVFQQLGGGDVSGTLQDIDLIMDIPVKLTVELGRTRMTIKELLRLTQGSVVALDGLAGEPLDILINGYLIAQGEVVVVADKYGVRITDIITPSERMRRLSRKYENPGNTVRALRRTRLPAASGERRAVRYYCLYPYRRLAGKAFWAGGENGRHARTEGQRQHHTRPTRARGHCGSGRCATGAGRDCLQH